MGEFSESNSSWNKMVMKRDNETWISTIKSEVGDSGNTPSTTGFSLDGVQEPDATVKYENEGLDYRPESTYASGRSSAQGSQMNVLHEYEPHLTIHELDPLLLTTKRPRKPSSGGVNLKNETPQARAVRLARMSAYAAQRIATESPEQRALRLKRMSEYAARRLARETPEQRSIRLARMSEYAARRIANETPEQRAMRLQRMSAYAAQRQARKKMEQLLGSPGTEMMGRLLGSPGIELMGRRMRRDRGSSASSQSNMPEDSSGALISDEDTLVEMVEK